MEKEESLLKLEELSFEQLSGYVNQLIDRDFPQLLQLLYRLDVSEQKIRSVLIENPEKNAGEMIAALIIERIAQREKFRQQFQRDASQIPDDEKW